VHYLNNFLTIQNSPLNYESIKVEYLIMTYCKFTIESINERIWKIG